MVISLMTVGQKLTAAIMNQIIGAVNQTALTGIIPTSVAGTGVTMSPDGSVTATNAASVSLNGVFSGTYDNYRIVFNSTTRSAANTLYLRLRQAGTDIATATTNYSRGYDSGTTRTVNQVSAATSAPLDVGNAVGQTSDGYLDMFGPAKGSYTAAAGIAVVAAGTTITTLTTGFQNSTTSSSDGFTILLGGGGTFSATIRVYGYNNLT